MTLAEQYKTVLGSKLGYQCAIRDYAADFADFWDETDVADGNGLCPAPEIIKAASESKENVLVIIWDGMPADSETNDKLLAPHLTPLDWALAFSMRLLELGKTNLAKFSIHIIDLTVQAYVDSFVQRIRATLLDELSWVKLYAPMVPESIGRLARYRRGYRRLGSLINVAHDVVEVIPSHGVPALCSALQLGTIREAQKALELFAKAWRASIVQSKDHHDLNNVMGPLVINAMLANDHQLPVSALSGAFLLKLRWMQFFSATSSDQVLIDDIGPLLKATSLEQLRVLVIDDELAQGWDSVICQFFGTQRGEKQLNDTELVRLDDNASRKAKPALIEIYGGKNPLPLIDNLNRNNFFERDFSFSFASRTDIQPALEILVLDLRLFGPISNPASRGYIENLVRKIEEWGLTTPENLAWQPIDTNELSNIKAWLNPTSEAWLNRTSKLPEAQMEASLITLLPRILALASPLTPILLFSSTGRADIKEKLKLYTNIITGFSKPQVLQDFASVKEAVTQFLIGRHRALHMLAFRQRLGKCIANAADIDHYRTSIGFASTPLAHIDFFFDESAHPFYFDMSLSPVIQNNFVLGSAATVFTDTSHADRLQSFLQSVARASPTLPAAIPVWNKARSNTGTPLPKFERLNGDVVSRTAALSASLGVMDAAIASSGAQLIANKWTALGVFRYAGTDFPQQLAQQEHGWVDQQLDLMLRFSVQFNVFILPRLLNIETLHCSLYFDRRSVPPTHGINYDDAATWNAVAELIESNKADALTKQFGVERTSAPLGPAALTNNPNGPDRVLVVTYPISSYYPLVREALMDWSPEWTKKVTLENVRGQQLSEYRSGYDLTRTGQSRLFDSRRWLHDIADWVAGAERTYNLGAGSDWAAECLKSRFPRQFRVRLDHGVEACMHAAQNASWGRAEQCIRSLLQNSRIYSGVKLGEVESALVWVCRDTIGLATGQSLHAVFEGQYVAQRHLTGIAAKVSTQAAATAFHAAIPSGVVGLRSYTAVEPSGDLWEKTASFAAPHGFELLLAASTEKIDGTNYWILRDKDRVEVAVAPVVADNQDPQGQTRVGQVGLWDIGTFRGFIRRSSGGGYAMFTLEQWFDCDPDASQTNRSPAIGAPPGTAVLPTSAKTSNSTGDLQGLQPRADQPQPVIEAVPRTGAQDARTWQQLIEDHTGMIEANVHSVETQTIVLRSADQGDRRPYSSDRSATLAVLSRGDKVVIRPKQGGTVMMAGRIVSDVIARYLEDIGTWALFEPKA